MENYSLGYDEPVARLGITLG